MRSDVIDNRVNLFQLEIFCRVAELRSVTSVAKERRVAQPAITGHLRSLERRVGDKLIYWDGRHMRLTEAGDVVLDWAKALLERTREASRTLAGLGNGTHGAVVIGASLSLGNYRLPPVLAAIQQKIPDLLITLRASDPPTTAAALDDGFYDFAVVAMDVPPQTDRVVWRRCGTDRFVVIGSPSLAPRGSATLEELASLPFVCSAAGQTTRRVIDQQFCERGVSTRHVVMECGHPESIKAAVRAGSTVALISRAAVADELSSGTLIEIEVDTPPFEIPIFLGHRAQRQFSPTQRELLEQVVDALRSDR